MVAGCSEGWVHRDALVKTSGEKELGLENQPGTVLHQVPAGWGSSPESQECGAAHRTWGENLVILTAQLQPS